jgi:hypothetical protein
MAKAQPEPRAVFATAEQFRNAAKILLEGVARGDQSAWVAVLSCEAFALELYLKCLAVQEGKSVLATHNLSRLFKSLDGRTQDEIRKRSQPLIEKAVKHLDEHYDFDSALKASAGAFEQTRYIYEGIQARGGWMCSGIMRITRDVVLERNNGWDPSYLQLPEGLRVVIHEIV